MGTENADFIEQLDQNRPDGTEPTGEGDDHLNLLKKVVKQTFEGSDGDRYDEAVTVGPRALNLFATRINDLETDYVSLSSAQTINARHTWSAGQVLANNQQLLGTLTGGGLSNLALINDDDECVLGTAFAPLILKTTDKILQDRAGTSVMDEVLTTNNFRGIIQSYIKETVLDSFFPVNTVVYTRNNVNPGGTYGGSWTRIAQGRFIVGQGSDTVSGESRNYGVGNDSVGRYKVALTAANNGPHTHDVLAAEELDESGTPVVRGKFDNDGTEFDFETKSSGSGTPHENAPPAYGLYVWRRTG